MFYLHVCLCVCAPQVPLALAEARVYSILLNWNYRCLAKIKPVSSVRAASP